eukprot:242281_1
MIALIYLFTCIQIPTITWCKTIISNSSTTLSNQVIACPNEDICSVQCLSYRSCFGSIIHCNRATECIIHCMDIESCFVASIYQSSQNNQVIIDCHGPESCVYLNIYKESNNNDSSPNTSFALYAANEASAKGATIHDIISHSNYFIHCNSTRSCDGLSIAFNPLHIHNQSPSYNMHIACVSIEACKDIAIETLSEWDAHITTNNIVYEAFEIDISCVETLSCFDARFDFAHLLIDGTTNTNTSRCKSPYIAQTKKNIAKFDVAIYPSIIDLLKKFQLKTIIKQHYLAIYSLYSWFEAILKKKK